MPNQNYSVRQIFEMAACTNCHSCVDVCPAVSASQDGELSALYRMKGIEQILKSRTGLFRRFFRKTALSDEVWEHFSSKVFRCTLCGNCSEVCPVGIHLKELWISLRKDLVDYRHHPKKINMIQKNLNESRNVFGEDNEERAEWVEDMRDPPEDMFIRDKADVVYFTGCTASFYPIAQKIPIALAEIFEAGEVRFTLMGEDEWCCGFPLLGAGLMDMFQEFVDHNIDAVKKRGAKQIVFSCPSCFQMWKEHYPLKEHGIEITHSTTYLLEMIRHKKFSFNDVPMKVTYHDPCDLGRGAKVFNAPREVIRSIPGIEFIELSSNREKCTCCGGGGNLEMVDAGLSTNIAKKKIEEVLETGAQAVVTACQQCVRTMTTFVKRNKVPIEVMDITQLIHRALRR